MRGVDEENVVRYSPWALGAKMLLGLAFALPMLMVGCKPAEKPVAVASAVKAYPVRGTVESVDAKRNRIELNAKEIPGFMGTMSMSYPVADPAAIAEMHTGDMITATLEVDATEKMTLTSVVIVGQAKPDYVPAVQYHVPTPGDDVPEFKLLNQSDKTIGLQQFHGKVLVMTFVYTRCPLADYCPKMSRNFAQIDKALHADPKLYAATHLLSVSFDPSYDTPKVLKSYGEAYTGNYTKETFGHWDFAAPSEKDLPKMEQYFDVGVTPGAADGQGGSLQHSLSTVVIGKDGKVVAFWPTNDWTVDEVLAKIKAAA